MDRRAGRPRRGDPAAVRHVPGRPVRAEPLLPHDAAVLERRLHRRRNPARAGDVPRSRGGARRGGSCLEGGGPGAPCGLPPRGVGQAERPLGGGGWPVLRRRAPSRRAGGLRSGRPDPGGLRGVPGLRRGLRGAVAVLARQGAGRTAVAVGHPAGGPQLPSLRAVRRLGPARRRACVGGCRVDAGPAARGPSRRLRRLA